MAQIIHDDDVAKFVAALSDLVGRADAVAWSAPEHALYAGELLSVLMTARERRLVLAMPDDKCIALSHRDREYIAMLLRDDQRRNEKSRRRIRNKFGPGADLSGVEQRDARRAQLEERLQR